MDTFSSVTAPRKAHQLDADKLLQYLHQVLPNLRAFQGWSMCARAFGPAEDVHTAHSVQQMPPCVLCVHASDLRKQR